MKQAQFHAIKVESGYHRTFEIRVTRLASNAILLTPPLIFAEEGSTDVKTGASKLMTPSALLTTKSPPPAPREML